MKIETTLEQMFGDYDWEEVFRHASGELTQQGERHAPSPVLGDQSVSADTFCLHQVEELIGSVNGENDGPEWVVVGKLRDGRYFAIRAGCDYTGWDCQSCGESWVASTLEGVVSRGLDEDDRRRLGA